MNEQVKKPNEATPESYSPKTPKLANMMDEAQSNALQRPKEEIITKKIIETTTNPNGWEYWEFPSCFASVFMRIEGVTAGRQDIITLYAVVSGISHVQLDMTNEEHFVPGYRFSETKVIDEYDDYIKFTMGFAGYSYERYNKSADKAAVFAAIKKSIDADRPVLINFGTYYTWCAIIGYDEENGTLYGLDNALSYWKDKSGTYEDGMFTTDHWYEYMTEAVIITGKTVPSVMYDDVFRRTINIMETMEQTGYVQHSIDYLKDNANFEGYDDEKYLELTGRISSLIALLIDQRAWVSHFFEDMAKAETHKDKAQYLRRITALYGISKDVCWLAWHMVGVGFPAEPGMEPEDTAKLLSSPIYRRAIADAIKVIIGNDRYILECLKEMMGESLGE